MRTGTIEVGLKGTSVVMKAACLSLGQAIAQWVGSDEWPPTLTWIVILAFVGAQSWDALSTFMSGTYERWKDTGSLANGTEKTTGGQPPKP